MPKNQVNLQFIMSDGSIEQASFLLPESEQNLQSDIYDRTDGVAAIPGSLGYGMKENGGQWFSFSYLDDIASMVNQVDPGRYYATIEESGGYNGVFEIIWLDNWNNDKTKETATKLVLFFGSDYSIRSTVRGPDASEPVSWIDLTLMLGNAAAMDVQETIYDRSPQKVALPGSFGYGSFFTLRDIRSFRDEMDLLFFVRDTGPGKYLVSQTFAQGDPDLGDYEPIIPGVNFVGIVEIEQPYTANEGSTANFNKLIYFRGINGEMYSNQYIADPSNPRLTGWFNLKNQIDQLRSVTGNSWGSPDVGGLILGVYQGESEADTERRLIRGKVVSGSRIGVVGLGAKVNPTGTYSGGLTAYTGALSRYPQSGSFVALSGTLHTYFGSDAGWVSLFLRIA